LVYAYDPDGKPKVQEKKRPLNVSAVYVTPLEEPWNMVIHKALLAAQEKEEIRYTWKDKIANAQDMERALREQAGKHADILIGDGYEHKAVIERVAAEFPRVAFVFNTPQKGKLQNLSLFDNLVEEPAYLCGLIAGKLTKSNTVGIVAG